MGIVVVLCLAVLAAYAVRALGERMPRRRTAIAGIVCAAALLELNAIPFDWRPADPIPAIYRQLAGRPRGPVAEFPFFNQRIDFHLHTRYMLKSTAHWQPLVNGYSDHIPVEFRDAGEYARHVPVEGELRRDARGAGALSDAESRA